MLARKGVFLIQEPEGFAMGLVVAEDAELLTLAVRPRARRRGIARRLLGQFEVTARAQDAHAAVLEVAADNQAACALYRNAGYREVGRRPSYYRTPEGTRIDALVLRRVLAE